MGGYQPASDRLQELKRLEEAIASFKSDVEALTERIGTVEKASEELINKIADLGNVYKTQRDKIEDHLSTPDAHHPALVRKNK